MTDVDLPGSGTDNQFKGQILVGSRIIDSLSSGLYKDPAACLKELVNNSFDADASRVRVLVKPDADRIIIEDDGVGMTRDQFVKHFSRISESHKRDGSEYTASGRPKIGKIGIGFIAANELCEQMEIFSTTAGSTELLHVTIDFELMRLPPEARKREGSSDYAKGDYQGEILRAAPETHFTRIFLKQVRGTARDILAGADAPVGGSRDHSLYGLRPDSIARRLSSLDSWSSLDEYSQTMLGVALNVPVPYPAGWIAESYEDAVTPFEDQVETLKFRVEYDGTALQKPVVLKADENNSIIRAIELNGRHVGARGYLYAQRGILRPEDLNGVLIRIRNAAVGEYNKDFMGFPHAEGTLFQRWVTAEIYADDRLEDALNIDRRTLRDTHPAFVELRKWFHDQLRDFLREVRRELHTKQSEQRKQERVSAEVDRIEATAKRVGQTYGPSVERVITQAFTPPTTQTPTPRPATSKTPRARSARQNINKKFSVSELYEVVLDVAQETLSKESAQAFIEELTKRLRG
jgi:hypothetical protein